MVLKSIQPMVVHLKKAVKNLYKDKLLIKVIIRGGYYGISRKRYRKCHEFLTF